MRRLLSVLVVLVALGAGATLATATGGGGWNHGNGSAHEQYDKAKPGCGPDKTDGVAGNSGQHVGQPPKDQNRGDCPEPPGQNKATQNGASQSNTSNTSSSNTSSSKKTKKKP
jgi:hypothetical protein